MITMKSLDAAKPIRQYARILGEKFSACLFIWSSRKPNVRIVIRMAVNRELLACAIILLQTSNLPRLRTSNHACIILNI